MREPGEGRGPPLGPRQCPGWSPAIMFRPAALSPTPGPAQTCITQATCEEVSLRVSYLRSYVHILHCIIHDQCRQ